MAEALWSSFGAKPDDIFAHADLLATEFRAIGRWARNTASESIPKLHIDRLYDSFCSLHQKLEHLESERLPHPDSESNNLHYEIATSKCRQFNAGPSKGQLGQKIYEVEYRMLKTSKLVTDASLTCLFSQPTKRIHP